MLISSGSLSRHRRRLLAGCRRSCQEPIEARVIVQRFQSFVRAHERSIVIAGLYGVVEIIDGFVPTAGTDGQTGEIVPEVNDTLARRVALICADAGNRLCIQLFRLFVAPGSGQSLPYKSET